MSAAARIARRSRLLSRCRLLLGQLSGSSRSVAAPLVAVVLGACALAACGNGGAMVNAAGKTCTKTYTIGFSHPVSEADSVKALKRFAQQRADQVGCVKLLLDNTTANNLQSQVSTVTSWVTQGVDAIVLWPVDPNAFTSLEERAHQKGIKWLTYSSHMDGQDGSVGFDNALSGQQIADNVTAWVKKNYPNGGVSAAVTTLTALPQLADRWKKPLAALKELGIPVVSQQDCADQTCGLKVAQDTLREHPDLRIFIGLNDDAGVGALKAFENSKLNPRSVYIAGQDGTSAALDAIKGGGYYKASAAIQLDKLGYSIVDNALAAITGKGNADSVTPTLLATATNTSNLNKALEMYQ